MRPYAKAFGDLLSIRKPLSDERLRALTAFRDAVRDGSFPDGAQTIAMPPYELEKFREALDRMQTGAGSAT